MSNGTGGQSPAAVDQAFQLLQQDFQPHNISFLWDQTTDYIDNDSYYNNAGSYIFSVNNNTDGIDIYLFHDGGSEGGLANGVGTSSEFFVSGSFWNPPFNSLITSHVISHEMGHVIFLWHTFHGGECPELVNGSNADICGDLVTDTPADPNIQFNVNLSNCTWTGSGTDANGDSYNPDELNIMAYTNPECMDYFTPLQGERMRNAIDALPFLQDCVVSNCPNCNDAQVVDLMIKDSHLDFGVEPNNVTQYMWTSDDIWVRHQGDQGVVHLNPEYHPTNPNYVYVRVINRSCIASSGLDELKVYWAKAATALSWDFHWTGNSFPGNGPLYGDVIDSLLIPSLGPGEEAILELPWLIPNPTDYNGINAEPWHFCLLARIVSVDDPMTSAETTDLNGNVRENNNIAWKNVTVVDLQANFGNGGVVGVYNPFDATKEFKIVFEPDQDEIGTELFKVAEIRFTLDGRLLEAWQLGGSNLTNIKRTTETEFLITGPRASLDNLVLRAEDVGTLNLKVHFLTRKTFDKPRFRYHVVQRTMEGDKIIGGETYDIRKKERSFFAAEAGSELEALLNEPITIVAEDINEAAIYNWYNSAGNLICVGRELSIATAVAEIYRLEVISTIDGFKDYSEVEISMRPSSIDLLSPNPSDDRVSVAYTLNNVSSAYLMVMSYQGGGESTYNYVLDMGASTIDIDLEGYPTGYYTVALVCDGVIIDAQVLSKL